MSLMSKKKKKKNSRTFIEGIKDSEAVKRGIDKKWDLDRFLAKSSQRGDINHQVKDVKKISRYRKYSINQKIMRRKASGAEEEIRGNRRNLPESKNTEREERKRQKLWLVWEGRNTSYRPKLASMEQ